MLNNWGHSLIREEVFKQFLFLLGLKLTYVNTVDIWDLDLIGLNLYAFNILELSQCPPLPHIFLHLIDVFHKYEIQLTLLLLLALIQSIQPAVNFVRFFNLNIQLFLKLSLHISLSQ
jgi:hypothetical protein